MQLEVDCNVGEIEIGSFYFHCIAIIEIEWWNVFRIPDVINIIHFILVIRVFHKNAFSGNSYGPLLILSPLANLN